MLILFPCFFRYNLQTHVAKCHVVEVLRCPEDVGQYLGSGPRPRYYVRAKAEADPEVMEHVLKNLIAPGQTLDQVFPREPGKV